MLGPETPKVDEGRVSPRIGFARVFAPAAIMLGFAFGSRGRSRGKPVGLSGKTNAIDGHEPDLLALIAASERDPTGVVGVIRFDNYHAMAAFNPDAAARVVATYAERMRKAIGPKALMARLDPNCHALWFEGANGPDAARQHLRAIAHVMAQEIADRELTVLPDIHVGAAQRSSEAEPAIALLTRARSSVVALKRFEAVELSSPTTSAALADRFALEQALRRAVENGELYLHYQPFIDTKAGRVVGAEALLRWRHSTMGSVSPATFVPILEETGLVHEIGLWTLNSACRQLAQWRADGRHDFRVAVNLSAIQLKNPALQGQIERTVAAHGLPPSALEIELTETAAMQDPARTRQLFEDLRRQGFGIAIDDFGAGHSNLQYLKDLPFTKLKIDREFVSHADTLPGSRAICKALVELSAGLGISVLAEGVERLEEVQTLERVGCTHFQGFYFSRGLAAEELTARLQDQSWVSGLRSGVGALQAEIEKRIAS